MIKRFSSNRLFQRVAEARFLTSSLLIHLLLISILGGVVLFKATQQPTAFEVGQGFLQQQEIIEESAAEESEFTEPEPAEVAPVSAPTSSALTALTDAATQWTAPISFNQVSVGSTLSSSPTSFTSQSVGSSKGMGKLGKASSVSFGGITCESSRVAFLLDASGSMILDAKGGGQGYAALKKELVDLVGKLDPGTEFNVILFGDRGADVFQPQAVGASKANVEELRTWIEPYMKEKAGLRSRNYTKTIFKAAPGGTTRLDVALTAALEMEAQTIFILTDGTPSVSLLPDEEDVRKWEERKEKNKELFERHKIENDKKLKYVNEKYGDEINQARKKAEQMNNAVQGRDREGYNYHTFLSKQCQEELRALNIRLNPPGFDPPAARSADAKDFNKLFKDLHATIYQPKGLPPVTVNIIGYYVDEKAEDYLKDMTRGLPGKFKLFRK